MTAENDCDADGLGDRGDGVKKTRRIESAGRVERGDGNRTQASDSSVHDYDVVCPEPESESVIIDEHVFCRYRDFQLIASGGGGIVESCVDPSLGRRVAVKMLQPRLRADGRQRKRFLREARIMAQVEHPNIMPVHELGECDEGNIYYTMKYIQGTSLNDALERLRAQDPEAERLYTLRQLIDIFEHVCQAVGFAHSRGVIHRDLKPENILLGDFGEVLVVDWGLAKVVREAASGAEASGRDAHRDVGDTTVGLAENITMDGAIAGTPAYMAPEQAAGNISDLDERTDVYALGAILYEILTLQRTVAGDTVREVMEQVLNADIPPPDAAAPGRRIPRELAAICMKSLCKHPADRYQSVAALLDDISAYRRGFGVSCLVDSWPRRVLRLCLRHRTVTFAAVLALISTALTLGGVVVAEASRRHALQQAGVSYFERGRMLNERLEQVAITLVQVRGQRVAKQPGEREVALARRFDELHERSEKEYGTAMVLFEQTGMDVFQSEFCGFVEQIYLDRLRIARITKDLERGAVVLAELRSRAGSDFSGICICRRDEFAEFAFWASGQGVLRVRVSDASVRLLLRPLVRPGTVAWTLSEDADWLDLSVTEHVVESGSYVLSVLQGAGESFDIPLLVEPGEEVVLDVSLPGFNPEGMQFVAGGPFLKGGEESPWECLHPVDVPGFFIDRTEVTVGEYRRFWMDEQGGRMDPALIPRIRFDADQFCYQDVWDSAGVVQVEVRDDHPVVGVTVQAAEAYCRWRAKTTGIPVRLPTEAEWEKAARGVDGRRYVWGDDFLPGAANIRTNDHARAQYGYWAPGGRFPLDRSVYGVFDLAGNVREWTASLAPDGQGRLIKGASVSSSRRYLPCAHASEAVLVPTDVGFRCVVSVSDLKE